MVFGHTVYKLFCYSWNVLSSVCFVICSLVLFFWSDLYVLAGNYSASLGSAVLWSSRTQFAHCL